MCCFDLCFDKLCCMQSEDDSCFKTQPLTCYYSYKCFECMDTPEKIRCDKCAPASEEFPQCIICFPCYFPICIAIDILSWPCREIRQRNPCSCSTNE